MADYTNNYGNQGSPDQSSSGGSSNPYYSTSQPQYQYTATQPPSSHGPKKKGGGKKTFFISFCGALVACVIALCVYNVFFDKSSSSGTAVTTLGSTEPSVINAEDEGETLAEAVAAKATPSVACIYVYTDSSSSYGYGMGSNSSSSDSLTESSLGSGTVLTADGYILTNYHVIEGSDALKVSVGGDTYDATVVGYDASSDIAVIKCTDASGLTPADIGDSDSLVTGEWVMSIGSPFGLESSVATGVVSATSRSQVISNSSSSSGSSSGTTVYLNMIQTDAAINPGNSGGALVDSDGKVIGVNTLITSYSGNYSGVGFAIPINYAINIADQIIAGKTPSHAQLGVSLTSVTSSVASRYGLATDSGAYVSRVTSGSGADEAGIEVGDIITKFDGEDVTSATDLIIDVRSKSPGDTVTLTINRDGQVFDVEVTLGSDSSSTSSSTRQQNLSSMYGNSSSNTSATSSEATSESDEEPVTYDA